MNKPNSLNICIVGLGYVGLPLLIAFAEKYKVVGFDINIDRILELENCHDRTNEIEFENIKSVKDNIKFTNNIKDASKCKIFIVTVPTPIDEYNRPDLSPLINSSKTIGSILKKNDIVVYESTVYPGVTEEICIPEIESSSGLIFNKDFFCGYSPERINPGDKTRSIRDIKKITSGSTKKIARKIDNLYKSIISAGTYLAPSIRVAEASKVIENTQRDLNIALINELAIIFNHMGIDTKEVIEAASTKWNFIKLSPGLVGGHCIGVDPYYLTFKSLAVGYQPNLILTARQVNNSMSNYIVQQTVREMINSGKLVKGSDILVLGLTFKENCSDIRNSKVIDIVNELNHLGANVDVYDPYVDQNEKKKKFHHGIISNPLKSKKKYDAIILAVAHKEFIDLPENTFKKLSKGIKILIDVKGITKKPTWKL